jgi:hypothetical protein
MGNGTGKCNVPHNLTGIERRGNRPADTGWQEQLCVLWPDLGSVAATSWFDKLTMRSRGG